MRSHTGCNQGFSPPSDCRNTSPPRHFPGRRVPSGTVYPCQYSCLPVLRPHRPELRCLCPLRRSGRNPPASPAYCLPGACCRPSAFSMFHSGLTGCNRCYHCSFLSADGFPEGRIRCQPVRRRLPYNSSSGSRRQSSPDPRRSTHLRRPVKSGRDADCRRLPFPPPRRRAYPSYSAVHFPWMISSPAAPARSPY